MSSAHEVLSRSIVSAPTARNVTGVRASALRAHRGPMYLRGRARAGPTFREAILMHAIARLALHPLIPHI